MKTNDTAKNSKGIGTTFWRDSSHGSTGINTNEYLATRWETPVYLFPDLATLQWMPVARGSINFFNKSVS